MHNASTMQWQCSAGNLRIYSYLFKTSLYTILKIAKSNLSFQLDFESMLANFVMEKYPLISGTVAWGSNHVQENDSPFFKAIALHVYKNVSFRHGMYFETFYAWHFSLKFSTLSSIQDYFNYLIDQN